MSPAPWWGWRCAPGVQPSNGLKYHTDRRTLADRGVGAAAGKSPGRRLTTCCHGAEQPLPTHSHASTLQGLTLEIWQDRGLPSPPLPRTTGPFQQHLGGSAVHLDPGAEHGEGRHGTAPQILPRVLTQRREGSSAPREAAFSPMVFKGSPKPASAPLPCRVGDDAHRWDREVTSAKMPSGRLEMSLPWRDLQRTEGPAASMA